MSHIPADLSYTQEHEWVLIEDNIATVGITDHAQEALGDLVFVELPEVGSTITKDDSCAVLESVKAASELYAPLSGKVVETNDVLTDAPETINSSPYEGGWIIKIEISEQDELSQLLTADAYKDLTE